MSFSISRNRIPINIPSIINENTATTPKVDNQDNINLVSDNKKTTNNSNIVSKSNNIMSDNIISNDRVDKDDNIISNDRRDKDDNIITNDRVDDKGDKGDKGDSILLASNNIKISTKPTNIITIPYFTDKYNLSSIDLIVKGMCKVKFVLSEIETFKVFSELTCELTEFTNIFSLSNFGSLPTEGGYGICLALYASIIEDKEDVDKEDVDKEDVDKEDVDKEDADKEDADKEDADKEDVDKEDVDKEDVDKEDVNKEDVYEIVSCIVTM